MRHLTTTILTFVIAALLTAWIVSTALSSGFSYFGTSEYLDFIDPRWIRPGVGVVSVLSGLAVLGALIRNPTAMSFTDEVIEQLLRVTWPSRDETVQASVTVVFTTLFVAGILSAYDFVWKNIADTFLFSGS